MSYAVQVAQGGYIGWKFLQRNGSIQRELLNNSPEARRSRDYFTSRYPEINGIEDILSDYRLRSTVLSAFGLANDVHNTAFLRAISQSDLDDPSSLANRAVDKRYVEFARTIQTIRAGQEGREEFYEHIVNGFQNYSFEHSVGKKDENIRLALSVQRKLPDLIQSSNSEDAFWYSVLGSKDFRSVFDGAFGFSDAFGKLPIDRQLAEYKVKATKFFGSTAPESVAGENAMTKLFRSFFFRTQLTQSGYQNPYSIALTLLKTNN